MSQSTTISRPESSSGAPFLNLNRYSQNIAATLTATLLLVLLLAIALWPMVAHDALLGWSMLVCTVQAGQAGLAHRYLNMDGPIEPRVWKARFLALAVVSGIVWGTPFIAFGLTAHDPAFFALLFAIVGVTAYGGMAKLPVLSIALTFEAVVLLPLSAWLFLQRGTIPEFMGIAVLLYLAMLSLLFRQTSVVAAQRHSLQAHKKELGSLRQDSNQRMSRFLECVPGVFVTLRRDRDGVMTVPFARGSSPAFEGLDPKTIAESIAPLLALCHPEDTAPLLAELHASAHEQRPCHAEFRIGNPSCGQMVMELTAQPQQDAESGVIEWHGFMQDITERKAVEKSLRDGEAMLQEAQRIAQVGSWDVDMVNDKLTWSDETFRIWEIDKTKFKADFAAFLATVHPEDRERVNRVYYESVAKHTLYEVEHRLLFPDGRIKHILERGEPQYDEQGKPVRFIGTSLDITERRRLEEQLKMKSHVLDHSSEALYLINEQGQFVYVNDQACRQLGYSREELLALSVPDIDPGFEQSRLQEQKEIVQEAGLVVFETEHTRRDGSTFPVEIQASYLEYNGQLLGLSLARNIGERKCIEQILHFIASPPNSADFMSALTLHVGKTLGMAYVFISHLSDEPGVAETIALYAEGRMAPNIRYALADTPCDNVVGKRFCCYSQGLQAHFPKDAQLVDMGADSYAGVSLWDSTGKSVGFIAIMDTKPFRDEALVMKVLQIVAPRAAAELERRESDLQLREREREFRSLAENMPDNIARWDTEGRYLYVNPTHERLLGMKLEDLVGLSIPDSHSHVKAGIMQVVASGQALPSLRQTAMVDGEEQVHEVTLAPEFDASGKVVSVLGVGRDMTKIYRMQETIAAREREFRSLAENMPDSVVRWDREGRYTYINPTLERALGASLGEIVGKLPSEAFPDRRFEPLEIAIGRLLAGGGNVECVPQPVPTQNGQMAFHEVNLVVERDDAGEVIGVLGLGRDVTEHKRMQETIVAREQEFRSLAESAPDNIVRYDREGRCLYLNGKLLRQLGLNSMDEAIGKRPSEVWPDGRFSKLEETAAHVVASGERAEIELTEPDGMGGWLHHWISVVPELDARGDIIGTVAFGRNVTERKRMEIALAARAQEFHSLAESAPDNIVRYDKEGRHRYLSQQLVRQLGLASAEEALGKRPSEVWPDGRFTQLEEAAAQVVASGERAELELDEPNGKENWLHHWVSIVPELDAEGDIIGTIAFGRDISERKQMEQALAEREAFLGTLLDAISIPVFYKDRQGRYLGINRAFEQYFGAERENLVGKSVFDTHPREFAEVYHAKDVEVFERRVERQEYEFRIKHSDGRPRDVLFSKAAFADASGEVKGLIGAVMDITERKQAEIKLQERFDQIVELNDLLSENARQLEEQATELEASQEQLKETEAWYRSILHSAPDGMMVIDEGGRIALINAQLERMFGYEHGELLGYPLETLLPAELRNAHENLRRDYFGNSPRLDLPGQTRNLRACRKDGSEFVADVTLSRLPPNDYNPGAICAAVRDVTERRRGEQEMAETRNRLKSVLHTIPDLVWMKNTEGEYLACNPAFERLFGAGEAEIIGKTDHDFVEAELADFFRQKDMEAIDSASMRVNEEWVTFASDGKRVLLETRKVPVLDAQGMTTGVLGVARDITDIKAAELRYRQALEFSESVLNAIPDLLFELNGEGRYLNIWAQRPELLAAPKEALLGRTIYDVLPPDAAEICYSALNESMANRISLGKTYHLDLPHGTEWFELSVSRKSGGAASDPHFLAISRNVTERKRLELEVAKREHEFRTLVENAADTVARYGKDMRRLYANPSFAELVEGGVDALLGKKPSEAPGGPHADAYEEKLAEVMATGEEIEFELRWTDKSGRELCSLINLTPEFGKDGTVQTVLAVGRDISELYAVRQKIHQMAFYDTLTELPNRALFNDRLRQMIADASWHHQLGGVMMLDMDRFKEINDTMGHAVGDELLREAGARLSACVRSYDTVARLGGDEFAVLLPDVRHGDDIGRIADKMRSMFDRPFLLAGKEVFVTCSIGIALYPDDSTEADDLLRYADSAMYYAKRSGRNAFRFYSRDLTESANERLMLESELRRAVERNELEMYYQPKVRLNDGTLIGSEALLRWKHPQRGMIPPDKFIPIAEDSGLIIEIGDWVLRESCRAAAAMNGSGKPIHKVAINLSARQFQTGDLLAVVSRVLDETHCRPEWIELEITESLLLDEDGRVLEALKEFRSLGITVAIDDFGTGYSALSYLARFPINTLKIDRSFVGRIDTDSFRAELVKAILSIAHCLGQEVVAEGVETEGQAAFLTAHGCQVAQGYLFSKPVPMAEFVTLPRTFQVA